MANVAVSNAQDIIVDIGASPRRLRIPLIILMWVFVALVATAAVVEASSRYPISTLEQRIPLWPPHLHSGVYLHRTLVEPFFRWDALYHFTRIVTTGYGTDSELLAFYPVYPMVSRVFYLLGLDPALSLLLVSWAAGIAYLFLFRRLATLDLSPRAATWATLLLLVFPMSLMLFVPYIESLFLFLSCLAVYFARRRLWLAAGLAVTAATLTKQPGIFLLVPLAYELSLDRPSPGTGKWSSRARWLVLASAPTAMILWTAFRTYTWDPGFSITGSIPEIILKALVSSKAGTMVVSRPFEWPWQIIADAVRDANMIPADRLNVLFNLGGYFAIVLLLLAGWKALRPSYRLYVLCVLIFTMLDYSFDQNAQPLTSMFRHAYLAFPVFLAVPGLLPHRHAKIAYAVVGMSFFIILLYAYVMDGWII